MKKKKKIKLLKTEIILLLVIVFMEISMIGMSCNFKVIQSNGGLMPVESDIEYIGEKHFTFHDASDIKYYYLSDIYHIDYGIKQGIYSIGDIIMYISLNIVIILLVMFMILKFNIKTKKCK